jgi:hypothetical protein
VKWRNFDSSKDEKVEDPLEQFCLLAGLFGGHT